MYYFVAALATEGPWKADLYAEAAMRSPAGVGARRSE